MKTEMVVCSICRKKQEVPLMKQEPSIGGLLNVAYWPDPKTVIEDELEGGVQKCEKCGFVFPRIDEGVRMRKSVLKSESYQHPFGQDFKGREEAVVCYQIASAYYEGGCRRYCIRWLMNAAVLLEDEKEWQKKCYRETYMLLKREVEGRNYYEIPELCFAYLNVMRLLGMFDSVVSLGNVLSHRFRATDREIIRAIMERAKEGNSNYITYFEMTSQGGRENG